MVEPSLYSFNKKEEIRDTDIIKEYQKMGNTRKVAKKLHVNLYTVRDVLKENNVLKKPGFKNNKNNGDNKILNFCIEYLKENGAMSAKGLSEIMIVSKGFKKYNASPSKIANLLTNDPRIYSTTYSGTENKLTVYRVEGY